MEYVNLFYMGIGVETTFFTAFVIAILILYVLAMIPIVKRSLQKNHKYKWNNITLLVIVAIVIVFLAIPYKENFLIPYPWNFFLIVFAGAYFLALLIVALFKPKEKDPERIDAKNKLKQEFKRKSIHLLSVVYYVVFLFGPLLMIGITYVVSPLILTQEYYETVYYLAYIMDPMAFALSFIIFIFIGSFIVMMNSEFTRLNWPDVNYPIRNTLKTVGREDEENSFGAHPCMMISWCLGTILLLWFSPNVTTAAYTIHAMIMISIFGDMYAALIGRKFGKYKWNFLKDKSIEGTLAGFIASLLIGALFVGFILALVGAIIFVITDIIFPKFTNLSDNLLTPLLITICFIILVQIPNIVQPILVISFIGIDAVPEPDLEFTIATGFYGSFAYVVLVVIIPAIIGLILLLKYRREQIIYLFTGKKTNKKE